MKRFKLCIWALVAMSACGDSSHSGEQGYFKFQFGLYGCTAVDVGGKKIATGAQTALIVTDDKSGAASVVDVQSESPSALAVGADFAQRDAGASIKLSCDADGGCSNATGALGMTPTVDGTTRLVFSRGGQTLDALKVTAATPTSMIVRDAKNKSSGPVSFSLSAEGSIVLEAVLKDSAGSELAATQTFVWTSTGPLRAASGSLSGTTQSGATIGASDAGTGDVSVHFGTFDAHISVEAKP